MTYCVIASLLFQSIPAVQYFGSALCIYWWYGNTFSGRDLLIMLCCSQSICESGIRSRQAGVYQEVDESVLAFVEYVCREISVSYTCAYLRTLG